MKGHPVAFRRLVVLGAVCALIVGIVGSARGTSGHPQAPAVTVTVFAANFGPIPVQTGQVFQVALTNLGSSSAQSKVTIYDHTGAVMKNQTLTIAPGATGIVGRMVNTTFADEAWRAFALTKAEAGTLIIGDAILTGSQGGAMKVAVGDVNGDALADEMLETPMVHLVNGNILRVDVANLGAAAASYDVSVYDTAGALVSMLTISGLGSGAIGTATFPAQSGTADRRVVIQGPAGTAYTGTTTVSTGTLNIIAILIGQ